MCPLLCATSPTTCRNDAAAARVLLPPRPWLRWAMASGDWLCGDWTNDSRDASVRTTSRLPTLATVHLQLLPPLSTVLHLTTCLQCKSQGGEVCPSRCAGAAMASLSHHSLQRGRKRTKGLAAGPLCCVSRNEPCAGDERCERSTDTPRPDVTPPG